MSSKLPVWFAFAKWWYDQRMLILVVLAWCTWLFVGTVFYAFRCKLGWRLGFYMEVNVGYSIGWGYPIEIDADCEWFSVFNVLVGGSGVAAALGYFVKTMMYTSKQWYITAFEEETHNNDSSMWQFLRNHAFQLKGIGIWMFWIAMMTGWSCARIGWPFVDGLYFAISSLSTGGMWPIPRNSDPWDFFIVGLFTCTGVPLMGLAMSCMASFIMSNDNAMAKRVVQRRTSMTELRTLERFNLTSKQDVLLRSEFVLLCCLRLGALDQQLVQVINKKFDALDRFRMGIVSHDQLLGVLSLIASSNEEGDEVQQQEVYQDQCLQQDVFEDNSMDHNNEIDMVLKDIELSINPSRHKSHSFHTINNIDNNITDSNSNINFNKRKSMSFIKTNNNSDVSSNIINLNKRKTQSFYTKVNKTDSDNTNRRTPLSFEKATTENSNIIRNSNRRNKPQSFLNNDDNNMTESSASTNTYLCVESKAPEEIAGQDSFDYDAVTVPDV